jgi:lipopolysaccharide export system protein LptA
MSRIRLLRIVIPIALLVFVAAIGLALRSRPEHGRVTPDPTADQGTRMEGFRFSDFVEGRRRLLVHAKVGRVDDSGSFELDEVERFEVDREGQSPLVLTASRGAGSGAQGKRIVRLEGGVTLRDDDAGLDLAIPTVEIDQVKGLVRSLGDVHFKNETWTGGAAAVVYSLKGEPTDVTSLTLDGPEGGRLTAQRAVIPAGARTLTLTGEVNASQGGMSLRAEDIVVRRRANGRVESLAASPAVTGSATGLGGGLAGFVAHDASAHWDEQGKVVGVSLSGAARVQHARGTIAADRIEAESLEPSGTISLSASGQVVASGPTQHGTGLLSCETLHASLDAKGVLHDGLATGDVHFEGEGTAGEAAEARVTSLDARGTVTLIASHDRRARLANGRIRIVADTIVSDVRGEKLVADTRVESTLLPAAGTAPAKASPMFAATEAVHFVSASLESEHAGARLDFRGDVRGWQGERTLSADEVELIQEGEILNASGHVATRMPRQASRAATEADFVQIGAERLAYRGKAHNAEYQGHVRVRQAEGWLEAPRVVATLAEDGPGMREVQASEGVRFEYRTPGDRGVPTTATGDGDRADYDTVGRVLRVFGDTGPATVRSTGPKAGVTVGRVLRYDVDTGALEVESGERDRATIRTPKKD